MGELEPFPGLLFGQQVENLIVLAPTKGTQIGRVGIQLALPLGAELPHQLTAARVG